MRTILRYLLPGLAWLSCEGSSCESVLEQIFGDENGSCGSGPERHVDLCATSPGRAELLPPVEPDVGQRFVHVSGVEAPSFAVPADIPARVNGLSIDEFMARHPRGYVLSRFADLDRDGDLDVVTADGGGSFARVRVLRNHGDGTFEAWQSLPSGYRASVCDVDVDGDMDVVSLVKNRGEESAGLFLNDGTGRLVDEAAGRIPPLPRVEDAVCFDADGDGAPEIVAATWYAPDRVLQNDGRGRFTEGPPLPPGESTASRFVLAGDLDGDGWTDVVIGGQESASRVLRNRGGSFEDAAEPLPVTNLAGGALGDIDGDGDPDLVTTDGYSWLLLLNDGAGRFTLDTSLVVPLASLTGSTSYRSSLSLGDIDGDGDLDWETESAGDVLLNTLVHPLAEDRDAPMLEVLEPVDGTTAHIVPRIEVRFDDDLTGVRPLAVRAVLNGTDVSSLLWVGRSMAASVAEGRGPWVYGDNLLEVEVRDLAGNGIRRSASVRFDSAARPFAVHLTARDREGNDRSSFPRGVPIWFVVRLDNGGGSSLPAFVGCGSPTVEVFDHWGPRWGSMVWQGASTCFEGDEHTASLAPCSSLELSLDWDQTMWLSGDAVGPGVYVVHACLSGEFPGFEPPPEIRISIE